MEKYTVFEVQGGIGKHVAFTGVLDAYKKANPDRKIVVSCAWPEILIGNPDIYRVYRIGNTPYFYQDYVHNKDVEIYGQEPYRQTSHITKKCSLIETWCDMIGVPYNDNQPKLFINSPELESGRISSDKPILIFQPFGGPGKEHQPLPYSWMRDIFPGIAQEMVNVFSQKYHVVHVCYDFHPQLQNCQRFDQIIPKKTLFAMMMFSERRVLIDSSLQHAAAALKLPSHVAWFATQPEVFGYKLHNNYAPKELLGSGTIDSYLYDYNFTGQPHECPFNDYSKLIDYNKLVTDVMA
jgi:hypothetical protein